MEGLFLGSSPSLTVDPPLSLLPPFCQKDHENGISSHIPPPSSRKDVSRWAALLLFLPFLLVDGGVERLSPLQDSFILFPPPHLRKLWRVSPFFLPPPLRAKRAYAFFFAVKAPSFPLPPRCRKKKRKPFFLLYFRFSFTPGEKMGFPYEGKGKFSPLRFFLMDNCLFFPFLCGGFFLGIPLSPLSSRPEKKGFPFPF